ncbi:hypothetical protein WJX72_011100 [[Myrmecia] bisecta]|uniref:FAD/NAD(P)-binding domain-containing protein n=1 Tax=[Myrmecia] bisecta TaxID=41462 RepID=A0AAW1Q5A5_9CHLO
MKHVVVGAGIAGVCCAEELCRLAPNDSVVLVASSTVLKGVGNVIRYSKNLEEFEVVERDLTSLPYSNLTLIHRAATSLDLQTKTLQLANNETLSYNRLVVCTGAAPKRLLAHERVLVLRDTDSVQQLCAKLPGVRRLVLVGNGGIALELVNALRDVEVVWVMKHGHIGDAFLDVDAATFLLQHLQGQWDPSAAQPWPLHVRLTNGHEYDADLVISAIGVTPELGWVPAEVERDPKDGGLLVNRYMQTSVPDVYAGGDACTLRPEDIAPHWFQMRLWTQARVMGTYAAHCMTGTAESLASGFNFELFTHATRFGGLKVVFLGLYNGQKLEGEPEEDIVSYSRATEGDQPTFVRVTLVRGRMKGAVLLGETELEEVFQNLILDNIDLSSYGPALLDPRVDLEDMFD